MSSAPATTLSGLTLEVVAFRAGAWRCAVEARLVRASRPLPPDNNVPELAERLGLAGAGTAARQLLLIKHPEADRPFAVTAPVQLQAIPVEHIHPLPPLLAATTAIPGLRALILDAEGIALLVDVPE
ncbi:MAG: hypothetical protein KGZ83_21080 [Sulfuricella sp.]|nr:hypothetical protein [Sulfuricella sp.]